MLHYGSGTCCICLEEISCGLKLKNCNHLYHAYCITTWLKENDTCPICRADVYKSNLSWYNYLFGTE